MLGWKKRNASVIVVLAFFLEWTFIGWVVALVWASSYEKPL
ncbi:MAG: superinfection immunity protein [Flavobacteriales bacterium]|nr:MAG: superinfection immunity protein [Flavobacteriales bacterium]